MNRTKMHFVETGEVSGGGAGVKNKTQKKQRHLLDGRNIAGNVRIFTIGRHH